MVSACFKISWKDVGAEESLPYTLGKNVLRRPLLLYFSFSFCDFHEDETRKNHETYENFSKKFRTDILR